MIIDSPLLKVLRISSCRVISTLYQPTPTPKLRELHRRRYRKGWMIDLGLLWNTFLGMRQSLKLWTQGSYCCLQWAWTILGLSMSIIRGGGANGALSLPEVLLIICRCWEKGSDHLQLCTHWGIHHSLKDSSTLMLTQRTLLNSVTKLK